MSERLMRSDTWGRDALEQARGRIEADPTLGDGNHPSPDALAAIASLAQQVEHVLEHFRVQAQEGAAALRRGEPDEAVLADLRGFRVIALQDLVQLVDAHDPTNAAITAAAEVSDTQERAQIANQPLQAAACRALDGLEAVLVDAPRLPTSIKLLLVDVARAAGLSIHVAARNLINAVPRKPEYPGRASMDNQQQPGETARDAEDHSPR